MNPKVTLPQEWMDKSMAYAELQVRRYENGECSTYRSTHGVESDVETLANAKRCECAFAIYLGLDPAQAVNWVQAKRGDDDDRDIEWVGKGGLRLVDVKSTRRGGQYLFWPIGKNDDFETKKFNTLVLVTHADNEFEIMGWLTKDEFRAMRQVAPAGHKLTKGTWHVHQKNIRKFRERVAA